jgi:hypothetical protein
LQQIIARNSYGGDTQEQDYVKALSHGKVAQLSQKAPVFQKTTSKAYCGQGGGRLYMRKENFISLAKGGKTRYNNRQHNGGGRRRRFGGFML